MTIKHPKCKGEFKKAKDELKQAEFDTQGVDVEKLTSVSDHVEARLLQGILEGQGIPSYSIDKESGGYMRVYMGYSIFGEDIYVRASDKDAAKACLKEWSGQKEGESVDSDLEKDQEKIALEIEKEVDDISGGRLLLFQDRRVAALVLILLIVIGVIAILPKM